MNKFILVNRDIPYEYVKEWGDGRLHLTQDIHEAHVFTFDIEADKIRLMAQEYTGCRWRIQEAE